MSDSEVKGKEGFKKEGLVNSVNAAKDGRRGASTSRAGCALTLSWDAGRAVIRLNLPLRKPPGGAGWVWTLRQTPGTSARKSPEQKQGGTETRQIAPLKPPEIRASGMFGFGFFPAAGYLKKTNLLKLQLQSKEPSVCLLLVSASRTNLLYSLVWIVSKADRNSWPRWVQPKSLPRVQSEPGTIRP